MYIIYVRTYVHSIHTNPVQSVIVRTEFEAIYKVWSVSKRDLTTYGYFATSKYFNKNSQTRFEVFLLLNFDQLHNLSHMYMFLFTLIYILDIRTFIIYSTVGKVKYTYKFNLIMVGR